MAYSSPMHTTRPTTGPHSYWAMSFPCTDHGDWLVLQGHADYCATYGHATYVVDDIDRGHCPRCGVTTSDACRICAMGGECGRHNPNHSEDTDYRLSLDCGCYCELHEGEPCDCECIRHPRPARFVAGWNTPGCLPETDPSTFDTATEAIRYLVDTIDRWWDDDCAACDDDTEREAIDARWLDVHSQLPYLTPPFAITANGISFWIEPITEGN